MRKRESLIVGPNQDREVRYVCSGCGSEDVVKLFAHETQPAAINCWKCHAGYNLPVSEMLMGQKGMFPVEQVA